ncbi:flavin monoamine oxidase family protein [Mycetocola miduiensis]|uniref:Monoamine oxidase n=1 Tax=Mycetocola miduiensis TaxID=995034 RepID=A0A1I5AG39_9MICO|nr:NAD(P)/FAD-dependent oxidoreductase [Mycetocola miduiensis]SFN61395.1 Monoamine oxidase [Mycetocola miduiensis]
MESVDVIVIGAGFAGATAARDSAEAGHSVLVLEGRDRLGGRTWYKHFRGKEKALEFGGTWIAPDQQRYVKAEIERYGLELFQSPTYDKFGWGIGGEIINAPFPFPASDWPALERVIARIDSDSDRIRFYEEPLGQPGLEDLDIPFSDYVDRFDLPDRVRDFILAWPAFYFGAYPDKLSALHVLSWNTGFGSAVGWYLFLVDKIVGGTGVLIERILHDQQLRVEYNVDVRQVRDHGDHVVVTAEDGTQYTAKHVIVTAPINTWERIDFSPSLPYSHQAMATEKQAGESVKIWALVPKQDEAFFGVGIHTTLKWLATEYTTDEGSYLCGFASAEADLDGSDLEAVTRAVQEFLPGIEVLDSDSHDWNNDKFSNGTWMAYRPGQVIAHSQALQQPHGRVFFGNSDLASGWAGWFDGAIESGARAAAQSNEKLHAASADADADLLVEQG